MTNENNNIQKIKSETEDYYSDDSLYKINSWGADLSFRELIQMYNEDELVKPEIQRNYVWDKTEASRFIDSLLLGLPVPSIFLAKTTDEKMLIVDGYQRIMTVNDYVHKKLFTGDGKIFKLSNSERINKRWRGKAFDELNENEQRKIKNTTIHSIIFVQTEPEGKNTSLYQVFERINTSGRTLFPQEIRNCVYQGKFNSLLIELNTLEQWRHLYGIEKKDSRMRDIEFILRFLAISSFEFREIKTKAISLKKYLNEYMAKINRESANKDSVLFDLRQSFKETILLVQSNFGNIAFHNISKTDPSKLVNKVNPTIFDSIMTATKIFIQSNNELPNHDFINQRLKLLRNEQYQNAISIRTTNIEQIEKRISLALSYLYLMPYE